MFSKHAARAALLAVALFIPSFAHANLLISDNHIVLTPQKHAVVISLNNNGDKTETYRLTWQEFTMKESGEYMQPETPRADSTALEELLVYSPRQVTLAPGESQSIRLVFRKPAPSESGEMRTHLKFMPVTQTADNADPEPTENIGIKVKVALGITIPIIYKPDNLVETATLTEAKLANKDDGKRVVHATIDRTGNGSTYGDLKIIDQSVPADKGGEKVVGLLRNVAVYNELKQRHIDIPVDKEFTTTSKLVLRYSTAAGDVLSEIPVTE